MPWRSSSRGVIQQVLEAQVSGGYRNGYRERQLFTRIGPVTLRVPQKRDGSFSSDIFSRYRRSEQAFVLGLMEMVVNGVSARKVSEITKSLCGTSSLTSTVSRLAMGLDTRVNAFLSRRIDDAYPFLIVDALFTKSRCEDRVCFGRFCRRCGKRRDVAALPGALDAQQAWPLPGRERAAVASAAKILFLSTDLLEARRHRDEFIKRFSKSVPKAVACLEDGFDDAMAVMVLPEKYRRRLRTTNMMERFNEDPPAGTRDSRLRE